MRREFCPWLLSICPVLQEYANIAYKSKGRTNSTDSSQVSMPSQDQHITGQGQHVTGQSQHIAVQGQHVYTHVPAVSLEGQGLMLNAISIETPD